MHRKNSEGRGTLFRPQGAPQRLMHPAFVAAQHRVRKLFAGAYRKRNLKHRNFHSYFSSTPTKDRGAQPGIWLAETNERVGKGLRRTTSQIVGSLTPKTFITT